MYNQCESCRKMIEKAEDCRLTSKDGNTIHTYCKSCFEKSTQQNKKKEPAKIIIQ